MNRAKSGKKKQRDLLHTLCQRTTTTYSGILFITANNRRGKLALAQEQSLARFLLSETISELQNCARGQI